MREVHITATNKLSPTSMPVEIVERKGIGHPDTICDALAEALSLALCRFYRDRCGFIMHHNVDKALLWGGVSEVAFGGGRVIQPIEIFLAGRATCEYKDVQVPIDELAMETCRHWFKTHMRGLDVERHVKLHTMIRPGSNDLVDLYLRQHKTGSALANDTSCGVGYAPLDELEQLVYKVEQHLNSPAIKSHYPEIGEDIKVMGVRQGESIVLTVACAFVDRYLTDAEDYLEKKNQLIQLIQDFAQQLTHKRVCVDVNTADSMGNDSLYLTVTGTSAESGDDGEVGRGNRVNGLITPYRPMNMEAAAGKNPVTHVGKLYNIAAQRIATSLVHEIDEVEEAQCYLVSRIGYPVQEPQAVDVRVQLRDATPIDEIRTPINDIVHAHLGKLASIQDDLIDGAIKVF